MNKRNNKLVQGFGLNDASYSVTKFSEGRQVWTCPYYRAWASMLARCYSEKLHAVRDTYADCSVCDEWLLFSVFKRWMESKDWQGNELDKDIMFEGNKLYSPETCVFVPALLNTFLGDGGSRKKSNLPLGVHWDAGRKKYKAQCHNPASGKCDYLGLFEDPISAHLKWRKVKADHAVYLIKELNVSEEISDAIMKRFK